MQVSIENTSALERRLTVQVPGDEIQQKVDSKLREMSKQVRIKGFRPGRVPMSVIQQRYGKQVRLDIVQETIQQSLQEAMQEQELRPVSRPRMDAEPKNIESGDLEFSAVIEVYPEIETLDVSSLEIERPQAEVADEDIDDMLNTLVQQRKTWNPVERLGQEGDQVLVEYVAEADGVKVPAEGKQRLAVIIGETGFDAMEEAAAKIAAGESEEVKITFPETYGEATLAGKDANVQLDVVSVSEAVVPEVNEEFIQSFGIEDGDIDTLKTEIRGNLERELHQAMNTVLKTQLIDKLVASCEDLDVPNSVVQEEALVMARQVASQQGQEQPDPAMVEAFLPQAEGRVRAGLLMGELAQQNSIRIDGAKVREAIETVAATYEQSEEVVQMYYQNQQLLQQVESSVLEEQVVDWALENAKVTPKAMKFQEVITAATQAARAG